jgi:hypothetical protein
MQQVLAGGTSNVCRDPTEGQLILQGKNQDVRRTQKGAMKEKAFSVEDEYDQRSTM